jgi:hypothetical protein
MKIDEELMVKLAIGINIIALWAIASNMDYHDAVQEEQDYINQVCEKHIPNYKKWNIDCATRSLQ